MKLPQVPPGGGGTPKRTHWTYVRTEGGAKPWQAWIAGPCHWYQCHGKGKTKPCLRWMTCDILACPRCEAGQQSEETGYQPLYREADGKPVMVIVHEYSRESIDRLKLHASVHVGRGEDKSDGVWIAPTLKQERYTSSLPERLRPADLTCSLLKLWGIPELVEWFVRMDESEPKPAAPPAPGPEPKQSNGKPFSGPYRAAARKYSAPAESNPKALDDVMRSITEKFGVNPSTNGDHK